MKPETVEEAVVPTMVEREQPQLWLVSTAHRMATPLMLGRRAAALAQLEAGEGDLLIEWSAPREAELDDVGGVAAGVAALDAAAGADDRGPAGGGAGGETDEDPEEPDPVESRSGRSG